MSKKNWSKSSSVHKCTKSNYFPSFSVKIFSIGIFKIIMKYLMVCEVHIVVKYDDQAINWHFD